MNLLPFFKLLMAFLASLMKEGQNLAILWFLSSMMASYLSISTKTMRHFSLQKYFLYNFLTWAEVLRGKRQNEEKNKRKKREKHFSQTIFSSQHTKNRVFLLLNNTFKNYIYFHVI
jgi:hypothetical protein